MVGERLGAAFLEEIRDLLGLAAGATIDDAALTEMRPHEIHDLAAARGLGPHAQAQIGPVETMHENGRAAPEQLGQNVRTGGGVGGRGECDCLDPAELGLGDAER